MKKQSLTDEMGCTSRKSCYVTLVARILLLTVTLGAGLVLTGCGDDDTATTPAPAPPPPPPPAPEPEPEPPPAPEPPATPTGLHVDETTETSIEWHWNAVEGATAYVVQVSMNEMFGDEDDRTDITLENHYAVTELEPDTTVYLRVAAAIGTSVEDAILSAFTTHVTGMSAQPPPPPPPPNAPATPTGLMVSESTLDSITWTWDAVEGALAYVVQASDDEMFDDTDTVMFDVGGMMVPATTETSYTATDLEPETTVFVRVAAAAGTPDAPLLSAYTTHVTGMSEAEPPPPPPPAPDPVEVTFSLSDDAKRKHFLMADDDNDEETAMATVNTEITVTSNASAVVTPMFVDGANGVSVMEGDNMPFSYVDWGLLQSGVLAGEATFMIQRTTMGANQEMEPSGDVAYVTCGPFNCADGMDAPELSVMDSAVCNAFDPEFTLQVGWIDNDVLVLDDADTTDVDESETLPANDGLDIGWVSKSTAAMTVTHHFSGVAKGENYSVAGRDAAKGTDKALAMDLGDGTATDADKDASTSNEDYTPALLVQSGSGDQCVDLYAASPKASGRGIDKPESCFRILGTPDYLSGYSIEVAAKGSAVAWGSVQWDDDPFEDLTCDSVTFMAAEQVDVCAMFEDEVDYALTEGEEWRPSVTFSSYMTGTDVATGVDGPDDGDDVDVARVAADQWRPTAWSAGLKSGPSGRQFTTLWFDDNLDGKLPKPGTSEFKPGAGGLNDLYNLNENTGNLKKIGKSLLDDDGDLAAGDLGKVDLVSAVDDRSTADDERTITVEGCPDADTEASGQTITMAYKPRDGTLAGDTRWAVDGQPCLQTTTDSSSGEDVVTTQREAVEVKMGRTATHPDGRADNYERIRWAEEPATGTTTIDLSVLSPTNTTTDSNAGRTTVELSTRAHNRAAIEGAGDFYKCDEVDGGDDDADDNTLCDAEWEYDAEILFASGTFGCTTTRMVTVTCEWDASGEMSVGRNRAPNHFRAMDVGTDAANAGNFIKCTAN